MKLKRRTIIDLVLLAGVLLAGLAALRNADRIGDWWHFLRYEPPADVVRLRDEMRLSPEGEKLFYRFSPRFASREEIAKPCARPGLGCVAGTSIYILEEDSDAARLRSVVTAAHEMLHVAYSRLTPAEKTELRHALNEQIQLLQKHPVLLRFSNFRGEEYYDEAHAYIGTEVRRLTDRLEAHYRRYFTDRGRIVDAFEASPKE